MLSMNSNGTMLRLIFPSIKIYTIFYDKRNSTILHRAFPRFLYIILYINIMFLPFLANILLYYLSILSQFCTCKLKEYNFSYVLKKSNQSFMNVQIIIIIVKYKYFVCISISYCIIIIIIMIIIIMITFLVFYDFY